jgi:hypothetical protein
LNYCARNPSYGRKPAAGEILFHLLNSIGLCEF